MEVVSVVGARPQFIKLKPLDDALSSQGLHHTVVHTGQHYDDQMSADIFRGLGIPIPDVNLEIRSGSHGEQTGKMLVRLESLLKTMEPDWVLVYGDTNSTVAATLASVKLGLKTAHVEAGLRSGNRQMPEEINRVLTDHACDMLLAPTELALENLLAENLGGRSHLVGDVMADLLLSCRSRLDARPIRQTIALSDDYVVATLHRASNTDDPRQLARLIRAIAEVELPVVLVAHPRLVGSARRWGVDLDSGSIRVVTPLDYMSMLSLLVDARGLITDSGGLQKEAFLLGIPCTTLRTESEWPETFIDGMNVLAPRGENLPVLASRVVSPPSTQPYGDGKAAERIVELLLSSA